MPHRETRQVWLLLKDGVPSHTSWGHFETEAEAEAATASGRPGVCKCLNACNADQAAALRGLDPADGWSAVPTVWRRPPSFIYGGAARRLKANAPRLEGRDLVIAGCRCSLDLPGRPVTLPAGRSTIAEALGAGIDTTRLEAHFADPAREPQRPDLIVEDEGALLACCEEIGAEITFTEKGTRKHWRVTSDPTASHRGNEVLIRRNTAGRKQRDEQTRPTPPA